MRDIYNSFFFFFGLMASFLEPPPKEGGGGLRAVAPLLPSHSVSKQRLAGRGSGTLHGRRQTLGRYTNNRKRTIDLSFSELATIPFPVRSDLLSLANGIWRFYLIRGFIR